MTTHPPEPPAPWPPSPDERPASEAPRPGPPDEWRAFERHRGDQPGNGHRAATSPRGAPAPLADYPPQNGYEPAPGQPPGPGYGPDDYPDYPAMPGYPDLTGYPRDGYEPPMPDYPAADYPPMPDYPPAPGYPPTPDYPHPHEYRAAPGSPDAAWLPAGHPTADYPRGGYPPGGPQVAEFPAAGSWAREGAPVTHEEYVHPGDAPASTVHTSPSGPSPAGAAPADAAPASGPDGAQWAMLGYLTVPFFGFLVPLAIYLMSLRRSRWRRVHAAQAINVWLTAILYDLSALIIGAVLMLDSPRVALAVVVPLLSVLWLTTLAFLVRAAARANRGETYTFPRWLCTPMVR